MSNISLEPLYLLNLSPLVSNIFSSCFVFIERSFLATISSAYFQLFSLFTYLLTNLLFAFLQRPPHRSISFQQFFNSQLSSPCLQFQILITLTSQIHISNFVSSKFYCILHTSFISKIFPLLPPLLWDLYSVHFMKELIDRFGKL